MLDQFFPDQDIENVYCIPFEELYQKGIRGVIFDIDNTLVPHGAPADEQVKALFKRLREMGMATCLLSNNREPRVRPFAEAVGSEYICDARKPEIVNYQNAMKRMQTDTTSTVFVGDQVFTDIWGAKRTGIPNILVKPIHPSEEVQIVFKRKLERIVLYFYRKKR